MPALLRRTAVLAMVRVSALVLLLSCSAATASAQRTSVPAAYASLSSEARAVATDTLATLQTRAVAGGRVDAATGVYRAAYALALPATPSLAPVDAARAALAPLAERFGWDPAAADLVVADVRAGRYSAHVTFRQTVRGVPVYGATVKINLDRQGRPTMAFSAYRPDLPDVDVQPVLTAEAAAIRARDAVATGPAHTTAPALVVVPGAPVRLAWRLVAVPQAAPAEWEVLVDAHTGDLLQLLNLSPHVHDGAVAAPTVAFPPLARPAASAPPSEAAEQSVRADGSGLVFDPDPLTSAGVRYAPPYVDAGDADVPVLNAERQEVVLRDITQGSDGLYRLEGPYVRVLGGVGVPYTPPAEADPHAFRYTRANPFFEAVMAYYHIDASQRYIQSLDVGHPIQDGPIGVNPHGLGTADDSQYFDWNNTIVFGRGGVDDAEDADVILHEYGHAILDGSAPGLRASSEGQQLHEGWGDYWAASYSRALEERGVVPPRDGEDWRKLYTWDGNAGTWCGRTLAHPGHYPDAMSYPPPAGCWTSSLYEHGLLWATTLMEVYDAVGRGVSDRLNLASHLYLAHPVRMSDAAHALVQADFDLYGGAHLAALVDVLSSRGFIAPDAYDRPLHHEPLASTTTPGGTATIDVQTSPTVDIRTVRVRYRVGDGALASVTLDRSGDYRFTGALPLPDALALVSYYVEGEAAAGHVVRLPAGEATYRFIVGVDAAAPTAAHAPMSYASVVHWPVEVAAVVDDNLGVDAVWARYGAGPLAGGAPMLLDSVRLAPTATGYRGALDLPASYLRAGDAAFYRIYARDVAGNVSAFPSDASAYEVPFRLGRRTDALDGAQAAGGWSPWAGGWSVDAAAGLHAALVLAPFHVPTNATEAMFVLDHAVHLTTGGGNVKVTDDDGAIWRVLTPEGGYPGAFPDGQPMAGEPAFRTVDAPAAFDLRPYAGRTIRLRLDVGAAAGGAPTEGWTVQAADYRVATADPAFDVPADVTLHANFPDPFARRTTIAYTLPVAADVDLAVFDLLGRRVAVLAEGVQAAGTHTHAFDADRLASGLYFVRLRAGGVQFVERMTVAR